MRLVVLTLVHSALAFGSDPDPRPPSARKIATARWMANRLTWGVLSTISSRGSSEGSAVGSPFGNVYSIADGPVGNGSGTPYLYTTLMDSSMIDIFGERPNANVSLSLSEAAHAGGYADCEASARGDPENPPCARLTLTGTFQNISGTPEERLARQALFGRHPSMADWPQEHGWFFGKVKVEAVWLIDFYGGATIITPKDYYAFNASRDA